MNRPCKAKLVSIGRQSMPCVVAGLPAISSTCSLTSRLGMCQQGCKFKRLPPDREQNLFRATHLIAYPVVSTR